MTLTDPTPRTTPLAQDGATARPHEGLTYEVRTFGCQMNVHDSERISGLLESTGYAPVAEDAQADLVVFNTCAVRENADNRLYGNLGNLRAVKDAHPGMQIAVGGCLAQKDQAIIQKKAPWVDVVFGTHNIGSLPVLLERSRHNAEAEIEILESLEASGLEKTATKAGSVSISKSTVAQVTDWDEFLGYIYKNKYGHLLQRRVSDPAWRELQEQGKKVPGTTGFIKKRLNYRAA